MGAYGRMDEAIAGLKVGVESQRVGTFACAETAGILPGTPVFGYSGDSKNAYKIRLDTSTNTLDADLVTSNVITMTPTIEGVAQTPIAVTFDTDHDTTMDAIKAAIEAAISGAVVTLTDATNNRVFVVFVKGKNVSFSCVVTLGASQATVTSASTTVQIFLGVAMFTQVLTYVGSVGTYVYGDAINVMEIGVLWVPTAGAVSANTKAYVVSAIGATQGLFSTSGYSLEARYRDSVSAAGLVKLEVRGQEAA